MNSEIEKDELPSEEHSGIKDKISGIGQMIIGEIQTVGGILTGDPVTRAEGEFNVAVGQERENVETEIVEQTPEHENK